MMWANAESNAATGIIAALVFAFIFFAVMVELATRMLTAIRLRKLSRHLNKIYSRGKHEG